MVDAKKPSQSAAVKLRRTVPGGTLFEVLRKRVIEALMKNKGREIHPTPAFGLISMPAGGKRVKRPTKPQLLTSLLGSTRI
jgi:hypothetical protein